jgi:phenylpropionate dioxygenase-like ring-hydroxylating dioxygenase large terminal subunit
VRVPFTWKVTGWFMVGWSPEFAVGEARPLHYFGEDLVAYRDQSGQLHVLEAHCKHLGAHIGHGGTVVGDCVECPFHGWRWAPDGTNRYIPYQPDRPNRALALRVFPVQEQYDCVFVWHHPHGKEPQWEMPDIFTSFPQFDTDPAAYYRPYPEFSRLAESEPVHPQIVAENGQRPFQVRAPRHGDAEDARLENRRPGVALPHRLARCRQRRSRSDGVTDPQSHVRPRRRDQRVRRRVEPPADLRLHTGRRPDLQHVLFDLVASAPATPPTYRPTSCANASRNNTSARYGMT